MGTSTPTKILIEIKCVNDDVTVEQKPQPQHSEGSTEEQVTQESKIKVEVKFNDKKNKGASGAPKDADPSKTAGINVFVNDVPMEPAASHRSKSEDQSGATTKSKETQTPPAEDAAEQAGAKEEEENKKNDTQEEASKLDSKDDKQEAGDTQQQSSGQDADMVDQSPPKKKMCGFADGTTTVRSCGGNLVVSRIVQMRRESVLRSSSVEGEKVISESVLKVIRRKLYEFYAFKEEPPTLEKLQQALKKEINFVCSRKTLYKALRADGYRIGRDQELIKMPRNYTVPDKTSS